MPDHLRSFYIYPYVGDGTLQPGFWEKIGEALLWLQLCWIVAGFGLMVYLAFKVFPKSENASRRDGRKDTSHAEQPGSWCIGYDGAERQLSLVAGNYRLEAFPQKRGISAEIIEFRSEISARNRRLS